MKLFLLSAAAALIVNAAYAQEDYNIRGSASEIDLSELDTKEVKDMFLSELSEGIEFDEDEDIELLGGDSCQRNNDCFSDEFCNDNGRCVKDDTGRRCRRSRDCGADQRCRNGRCKRDTRRMDTCNKRSDCGAHMRCIDGYCQRRDFEDMMEELVEEN